MRSDLTPADLADIEIREEFYRRTGGPLPRAMRAECAPLLFPATFPPLYGDADHGPAQLLSSVRDLPAPAGRGAHTPLPPSLPLTDSDAPRQGLFHDLHALQGRRPEQVDGSWAALRLLLLGAAAFYLLVSLGLALAALAGLLTNDTGGTR